MFDFINFGSGNGFINSFLTLLIVGVCLLLIWLAGRWVCGKTAAPPIVLTCWTGLFGLVGLIVVINFLMSLVGHGFITY
jgi:hypothetical protein